MKNRILALFLCLCLLASTSLLFSSCGKKTIDLTNGYTVVYRKDATNTFTADVKNFISALEKKSDQDVYTSRILPDDAPTDLDRYEILVGNTNREETAKALKKIKGQGYIITTIGQKVVIVGTTNLLTCMALEHFLENDLANATALPSLEVNEYKVEQLEILELSKDWEFVYSSYLRGDTDCVNECIEGIRNTIAEISDIRKNTLTSITDDKSAAHEILSGLVERPETKELLAVMDVDNYAVAAKNGKLIVTAFNDDMMRKAFTLFADLLRDSVIVTETGEKRLVLPADFTRIYTDEKAADYVTDFPRPEGLALSGTINVHNDSYEYYYESAGVSADAYTAYCKTLEREGYSLKQQHSAEDSIFRTYVNESKGLMLYAAYNAFKHASAQGTGHKSAIRLIVGRTKKAAMIPDELLTPDFSGKVQNSSITAVMPDYEAGKGQLEIITLENGSFIVIDGNTSSTEARDRIYQVLVDLYRRGHNGNDPTKNDPIRIAAWFCTHSHSDHIGAMTAFIKSYCQNYSSYCVTIDSVIGNFPSDEGYYRVYPDRSPNTTLRDSMSELSRLVSDAPGQKAGFEFIKVHTGQKLWLGNVELEVMYTHEELFPQRLHSYNNTSTVIRTTIHHTEGGQVSEGSATTALWLGDAQKEACQIMRAMFGSHLESDMVQIAHHIGSGSEFEIYALVKPTWAWYPCSISQFKGISGVGYQVSRNISSLMYIVVADVCNYTVVIGRNGADPRTESESTTGVFNAGDSAPVLVGLVGQNQTNSGFLKTKYNLS